MQFNYNPKEKIWDLSLRFFHIILILLIIGSIVSAKLNFLHIHELFGTSLLGLISFRILWGLIGTHHSRFKNLNLSLSRAIKKFSRIKQGNDSFVTKTFLGSYSTIAFILFLIILPISGLFSSDDILYDGPLIYGVFETTNAAIFKDWDLKSIIIDTTWGGILYALTTFIYNKIF